MRERISNIMSIVKALNPVGLVDFEESDENTFEVTTDCSNCRTFVRWEATAILRVEIIHILGFLDLSQGIKLDDLTMMLRANYGSCQSSGTFLGVIHNPDDNTFYVSQSTSQIFLPKWSDDEIADVIATIFNKIAMMALNTPPRPIVAYDFP
jgi:hypothetical protein